MADPRKQSDAVWYNGMRGIVFSFASKMPVWLVKEYADYGKYFEEQLKKCQVEYFDFYLLHAMNKDRVKEAENLGGFQFVQSMKAEGKIRHIGFSFHDKADVLDEILTKSSGDGV